MKKQQNFFKCLLFGLAIGLVSGVFGGGGGMLAVPGLIYFFKFSQKQSHATSVFIIAISTVASAIVYIVNGYVIWSNAFFVGIGAVAGCAAGAILLSKLKSKPLQIIFAIIVIAAGVKMMIF